MFLVPRMYPGREALSEDWWVDGWMGGWMIDIWMDAWMIKWILSRCLGT